MRTEPKNENWGIFHLNAKAFFVVGTLALTLMESGISILSVSADTVDTSWSNKYTVCVACAIIHQLVRRAVVLPIIITQIMLVHR